PLSPAEKAMIADGARRMNEDMVKKSLSASRWIGDSSYIESLERLVSQPTVNIEGLVGGYTGPGGKTILPHRAVAKLDLRLVPDMKAWEALKAMKKRLAKKGFGDGEVNMTGGYAPTTTPGDSPIIKAMLACSRRSGVDPILWPRIAGSWPGYLFTSEPLKLP